MSSKRYLKIIDRTFIGSYVEKKKEIIEITDPDRIYLENIRSFFNFPGFFAKFLCELAVRRGLFNKRLGILCPNEDCKRIIKSYKYGEKIGETFRCKICQSLGKPIHEFNKYQIEKLEFYQLRR